MAGLHRRCLSALADKYSDARARARARAGVAKLTGTVNAKGE